MGPISENVKSSNIENFYRLGYYLRRKWSVYYIILYDIIVYRIFFWEHGNLIMMIKVRQVIVNRFLIYLKFKVLIYKKELLSYSISKEASNCKVIFGECDDFRMGNFYTKIQEKIYREVKLNQSHSQYELILRLENPNSVLNKKIKDIEAKFKKIEIGIITTMGIFVSLITSVSVNINFF